MRSSLARPLRWLVALVIGVVYGTAGTVGQAYRLGGVPVGLVVALLGVAAMLVAMRALTADRWCALAGGVGAFGVTVLLSGTGPGGSVLVPGGGLDAVAGVNLGLAWTIGVGLAVMLVVAWPHVARPASHTGP